MMAGEQALLLGEEGHPQQQQQQQQQVKGLLLPTSTSDNTSILLNSHSLSLQQHESERHDVVAPPTTLPPRRVDHTYRDFSNFPLEELPTRKKCPTNFPSKLHQILSNPEYAHIISWMPHGRAWKIHDKELLIRDIVPKYFVQSKYESFTRQLNGWGFKRLHQSGNDFNAFYHECFLRGMPHLTILMKRVPPNQGKLLPYVEGEPNFYEIEQQFPLPPRAWNNNHNVMMSAMAPPSTLGEKMPFAPDAGYGHNHGASSGFPYYHYHADHLRNPASLVYPGTNVSYTYPPIQGEYQQGRFADVAEPPFSVAPTVANGQQMMGGLFTPQFHPYSFHNPMLYHGTPTPAAAAAAAPTTALHHVSPTPAAEKATGAAAPTTALSSVQGVLRCVKDEAGTANNALGESSTMDDQNKEDNDKKQE